MAELNFTQILRELGKSIVLELQNNIYKQRDINGASFSPRKIQKRGEPTTRLLVRGKLVKKAFTSRVETGKLVVTTNDANYESGKSYNDVIYYNNRPTSDNAKSPLVFPTTVADSKKLKSVQEFEKQLTKETLAYFESVGVKVNEKIKIG
jgi:hypothetical protein